MTDEQPRSHPPIDIVWAGQSRFDAAREGGPSIRIDSDGKTGTSSVDTLLASIATCSATDVVSILEKQRTPLRELRIRVESTRVQSVPRRLASVHLVFDLAGAGLVQQKAERAVELSVEKYCSVRSSLAPDITVTWSVNIRP